MKAVYLAALVCSLYLLWKFLGFLMWKAEMFLFRQSIRGFYEGELSEKGE